MKKFTSITASAAFLFSTSFIGTDAIAADTKVATISKAAQASGPRVDAAKYKSDYQRPKFIPFPKDNPYSDAKAELGKKLFFDPRLSKSNLISCASCHNPSLGWEDGQALGSGNKMGKLGRHTPTILNLAWSELMFWDGRMETLEEQALGPIEADVEMAQPLDELVKELSEIKGYADAFEDVFPGQGITKNTIGKAIATFERTVVSNLAPFDHWVKGDESAISERAKRGFVLFNTKARCANCHSGWNFTDDSFHDIGLKTKDVGRNKVLGGDALKHAFKTPGLRNLTQRAPFMHNGSIKTLADVVNHYDSGFVRRESLSDEMAELKLTAGEKSDLVAFLKTLESDDDEMPLPILPN